MSTSYVATASIYSLQRFAEEHVFRRPADPRVTTLFVEADRGLCSLQDLGEWILKTYPFLTTLYVDQNFDSIAKDDEWKTWRVFYSKLPKLKTLIIRDEQSSYGAGTAFEDFSDDEIPPDGYVHWTCDGSCLWKDWIGKNRQEEAGYYWGDGLYIGYDGYPNHTLAVHEDGEIEILWESEAAKQWREQNEAWEALRKDPVWQAEQARIRLERAKEDREMEAMKNEERAAAIEALRRPGPAIEALAEGKLQVDVFYMYLDATERDAFSRVGYSVLL